jgi:hypothetical protein
VFYQNRNHPEKLTREMIYVLTFVKPGVDAYRVVINAESKVGSVMDPKTEMMFIKGVELFTEAIPGTIIQAFAYLTGSNQSSAAVLSLLISIFTAAFTSTGISFDKDLDKPSRRHTPKFYGYVPNSTIKKIKVFLLMIVMSACHLSVKALAIALGGVESIRTVFFYLGIDMAIFFAYKLLRKDFWHFVPVHGVGGIVITTLIRIAVKLITDFTALLHARHPYELGGSYWAFTILSTPIVCFYFGFRYLEYVQSEDGKARELPLVLDATQVYGWIGGIMSLQILTLIYFLRTINRAFIETFYSTMTGNDNSMAYFLDSDDDEQKMNVFTDNRYKWKKIEKEVVDWVNLKIPEWNESQPEWWNARVKAQIPDWVVGDEELLHSIRSVNVVKIQDRRGSFAKMMGEVDEEEAGIGVDKGAIRRRTIAMEARRELTRVVPI